MMIVDYQQGLKQNIFMLTLARSIYKRAYLPLIVIYAVSIGVSFEQIGIIAGVTAAASLILEVPSGYLSDKLGHKYALLTSAFTTMITPLFYVFLPNFWGILLGSVVFFGGMAFQSGTFQAFLQETLDGLGRHGDFAKVSASIQRRSLVVNVILVSLVPLTYGIDQKLPFVIGFVLGMVLFVAFFWLTVPEKDGVPAKDFPRNDFLHMIHTIWQRKEFVFFLFLGFLTAHYNKLPEFREIYFQELAIPVAFFGMIIASASIAGILFTYLVPYFSRLKKSAFYVWDVSALISWGFAVSFVTHPVIGVFVYMLFAGYGRVRNIVIDKHLLSNCPDDNLKATYLSLKSFMHAFIGIFAPIFLGYSVGTFGLQGGYLTYTWALLASLVVLYLLALKVLLRKEQCKK